jgi:hypothetical protein
VPAPQQARPRMLLTELALIVLVEVQNYNSGDNAAPEMAALENTHHYSLRRAERGSRKLPFPR